MYVSDQPLSFDAANRRGDGCGVQPAITVAAVRTPEGWGGGLALELAMAMTKKPAW